MGDAPKVIYLHHADMVTNDGTQCLVFTSPAPVNFTNHQSRYYHDDTVTALQAELERLKEYAIEATKALTGLTVGGSEFFAGQKLGFFKADIPACVKNIRWRFDNARKMGEAKGLSSQRSEAERLRAGLQRIATPSAFYVGTCHVDPEAFARMIYAEKVLAGLDLELADKETEAETKGRYPLSPVKTQET